MQRNENTKRCNTTDGMPCHAMPRHATPRHAMLACIYMHTYMNTCILRSLAKLRTQNDQADVSLPLAVVPLGDDTGNGGRRVPSAATMSPIKCALMRRSPWPRGAPGMGLRYGLGLPCAFSLSGVYVFPTWPKILRPKSGLNIMPCWKVLFCMSDGHLRQYSEP